MSIIFDGETLIYVPCSQQLLKIQPHFYFLLSMIQNVLIKVSIKIKPCPQSSNIVKVDQEKKELRVLLPSEDSQKIQVDEIHDANETDLSIYQGAKMKEMVARFAEGYNIAIMSYGQTGSGKTFAFEGDKEHKGIISQTITDLFALKGPSASIKCSFVQLYNERIADMLSPQSGGERGLKIRWQAERQFTIQDLAEKECHSAQEMLREWHIGNKNRVIASNKIHQYSSRSHSIFIIKVEDQDHEGNYRMREAYFVDLAGSERVFSPVGRLSKEAIEINKSLFFLRKVIISLEEMNTSEKEQYIPYRDSKLTSILKRAFGGNCLTTLIACINPHQDYLEETLSTLQYAVSASRIHNQAVINVDIKTRQIRQLKQEKQKLKRELQMAMMQIQAFKSLQREEQIKRAANNQYANRIIECIGTVRELLKSNKSLRAQLEQQRKQKKTLILELQNIDKAQKSPKKNVFLDPIKETPQSRKSRLKTEKLSPKVETDRPLYSQSVDFVRKKERGASIIRRKRFTFYDSPQKN